MGKSSSSSAPPPPDPAIAQAAAANVELGKDYLQFTKDQWAAGNVRQDQYDKLTTQVVDSQLTSQSKADQWAQQDRDQGQTGKTQFDQLADKAGQLGTKYEGVLNGIAGTYGDQAKNQYAFADEQQGRYSKTFAPVEDRLASDAMTWDSTDRQDSEAAKAKADVIDNTSAQRAASQRQMEGMGVNPNSGRFAGVTRAGDITTALNAAGAQNASRDTVRQQGIALRGQAAAIGQNVIGNANTARSMGLQATSAQQNASQAAQGAAASGVAQEGQLRATGLGAAGVGYQGLGTGITAGSAAVGNQGAANSNFYANNGVMGQGYNGAIGANSSAGSMLNQQYGSQINAWGQQQQANAASSAGTGAALGTVVGAGIMVF